MLYIFIAKMFAAIAAWIFLTTWYEHKYVIPPLQDECYRVLRRYGRLTAKELKERLYADTKGECNPHMGQVYIALRYLEADGFINRERVEVEGEPFAKYYYSPTGKPKLIKSTIQQINNELAPAFSYATVLE